MNRGSRGTTRPCVLISDGQERGVLAAVRSLSRAGYEVDIAASQHPAAARWSRACGRHIAVTDPKDDPLRFAEAIARIAGARKYEVLIPGGDAALTAISAHRELIEPVVRIGLPDAGAVDRALDKATLTRIATEVGFAVPPTAVCEHEDEALAAADGFGYPVVFKSHRSVFEHGAGLRRRVGVVVPDEPALAELLADYGRPWLIQQRVDGPVVSFAGVHAGGRLLASTVSRYRRTWPPEAGNVSSSVSIAPDPDLAGRVEALIGRLGWQEIFELELVESPGGALPIDLNPRVYGSMTLAERARTPLAPIWCDWLRGLEPRFGIGTAGCRYRWEEAELRNLALMLRGLRLREAAELTRPRLGTAHAFFERSDPLPLIAAGIVAVRRRLYGRREPRSGLRRG